MQRIAGIGLVAALLLAAAPARAASSVRYALVVGNNHGRTPPGVELPDLQHAEAEAQSFRDSLVTLGNFDASGERVILLEGATRQQILAAADRLAARHQADRAELGEVQTLFTFYYSGHGLEGQLLTADQPLTGGDLARVFQQMDATFTVGIFDACFSGSLDLDALRQKGLRTTPGFNAFTDLPQEVLNSEGTMWFVSSKPDQVSYEDDRVGGVFSHFFIEAMQQAGTDSFGVTLDEIWEYARRRTQEYTSSSGRPQSPQKLVRNLTTSGPLYFSFPKPRDAVLAFEPGVKGRFLVRYQNGQLTELITKEAGQELHVAMYAEPCVLERAGQSGDERQLLELRPGDTVWVRERDAWEAAKLTGFEERALVPKGGRLVKLVLTERVTAVSGLLALEYQAALTPQLSGATTHHGLLGLRVDYGFVYAAISAGYGFGSASYQAWGYAVHRGELRLEVGPAGSLGPLRLGAGLEGRLHLQDLRYEDGAERVRPGGGGGAVASALVTVAQEPIRLYLFARGGAAAELLPPAAPVDADYQLVPNAWLSGGVAVGLF